MVCGDPSALSVAAVVRLVCHDIGSKFRVLRDSDTHSQGWKQVVRSVVRIAGMEGKSCTLFVPRCVNTGRSAPWMGSLEAILNTGVDLQMFDSRELQVRH